MKYFICILLSVLALNIKAQVGGDETVIPKSPNAASFDKLDQGQTDLATGSMNVSFKLFSVKTRSYELPVVLMYHGGGIKVDEIASWVGLGWSLDAGGLISRKINGNPDEGIFIDKAKKYYLESSTLGPINKFFGTWGYDTTTHTKNHFIQIYTDQHRSYGTITVRSENTDQLYSLANSSNCWGGYSALYMQKGLGTYPKLYEDIQSVNADPNSPALPDEDNIYTANLVDPQPDEFTIRIPGYSGKFYFNNNGVPQLNPVDNDLKISYVSYKNNNDTVVAPYIDTWMVSTPDGKQYYFGYGSNSKTSADGSTGSRSAYFNSPTVEWYLTKILDVNTKDSILFTYKRAKVASGRELKEYIYPNNCTALGSSGGGIYESGETKANLTPNMTATILTNITTSNEIINFYSSKDTKQISGEPPRLDSILIIDSSNGTVAAKFRLRYDYFKLTKKLKLLSFQKISMDQVNIQLPTSFSYYEITPVTTVFRDRYDVNKNDSIQFTPLAQDYWGYYNNVKTNYGGFLIYPASCSLLVNRKASWPYSQLGVLNKITYPTGGDVVYEYEPNSVSSFFGEAGQLYSSTVDGQYTDNPFPLDTVGGIRIKKITQRDSIGKISLIKMFSYNDPSGNSSGHLNITPSTTQRISQALCFTSPYDYDYILISNFNRTPVHDYGNVVNYARVTVKELDSAGNSNGYSIYTFFNDANIADTNFLSYYCMTGMLKYGFNGLGNMPEWKSHHSKGINLLNGKEMETLVYSKDNVLLAKTSNSYSVKQYNNYFTGFSFFSQSLDQHCNQTPHAPINFYGYSVVDNQNADLKPLQHYYYFIKYFSEYPKSVFLSKKKETTYTTSGDSLVTQTEFFHESPSHLNTTRSMEYNSKGDTLTAVNIYAFDMADNISGDTTYKTLKNYWFNPLIISAQFTGKQMTASRVTAYKNYGTPSSPSLFPLNTYIHQSPSPVIPLNTYGTNNTVTYPVSNLFSDNNFKLYETFNFNTLGNLLEHTRANDYTKSYIWDYRSSFPIAEAITANYSEIAYTSFEADGNGGWTISSQLRDTQSVAVTGRKSYLLSNGSISRSGLTSANAYFVSYWTKNASAYSITGTQSGYPVKGKTINGWTYFEHKIKGVTSVTISGTNSIDELRLYPELAKMSTLTYLPLTGITSQCDLNNRVSYYEYDGLQRLAVIRDQDRNAIKKICYNLAGQAGACAANLFYNIELSQSFTKNNCGTGYTGSTVVYTVPAGKYTAATASAANLLAQNDINSNGQAYANTNGECYVIYKNVLKSGSFTRNNCAPLYTGSAVTYTVPANTYTSLISQADADGQAQDDVDTNGQAYANSHGTCTSTIFSFTAGNHNYPNNATSAITVTLKNKSTLQTYTTGSFKGPNDITLSNLPAGLYTVTYSGSTYSPNTAIGIFAGTSATGTQLYCESSSGTTSVVIDNVQFDSGQYYYFTQISECTVEAPAAIIKNDNK